MLTSCPYLPPLPYAPYQGLRVPVSRPEDTAVRDTPEGWGGYSARWLQPPPPYPTGNCFLVPDRSPGTGYRRWYTGGRGGGGITSIPPYTPCTGSPFPKGYCFLTAVRVP